MESGDAPGVGFEALQFARADASKAWGAVSHTAAIEFLEGGNLGFVDGDDDLAAFFVGDAAFVAVMGEEPGAFHAVAGLEGAGSVVDAGVDDTAVVAGLVSGEVGLLFDDQDREVGESEEEFPGGG